MTADFLLGEDGELYVGTAGSTAATLLSSISNLTVNRKRNTVSKAWRDKTHMVNQASIADGDMSFTVRRRPGYQPYQDLVTAVLNGTPIALKTVPTNGESSDVVDGDFLVESQAIKENIQDAQEVDVVCKIYNINRNPTGI